MGINEKIPSEIDKILSKYISVWLWSILFGSVTAVGYSFLGYDLRENWGELSVLLFAIIMLGMSCIFISIFSLYLYLIKYIIPRFLFSEHTCFSGPHVMEKAGRWLRRAFLGLMLAILFRLSITTVGLLLRSLGSHSIGGF